MPNLRIGLDVLAAATISATSEATGASSTWFATNLLNPARDRSHRTTNLTTQSLLISFGGLARNFTWIALPRHKLHGANWRPRFYSTTDGSGSPVSGGDPTGSGGVAVAPLLALPDGSNWGLDASEKQNTDLRYYSPANHIPVWLSASGVKSIRIDYTGAPEQFGTSLAYYQATRVVGGKHIEMTVNVSQESLDRSVKSLTGNSRSGGASNRRIAGETYRSITWGHDWLDPLDLPKMIQLTENLEYSASFLLSFFPTVGTLLERDYTFVGTFAGDMTIGTTWPLYKSKFMFVED